MWGSVNTRCSSTELWYTGTVVPGSVGIEWQGIEWKDGLVGCNSARLAFCH